MCSKSWGEKKLVLFLDECNLSPPGRRNYSQRFDGALFNRKENVQKQEKAGKGDESPEGILVILIFFDTLGCVEHSRMFVCLYLSKHIWYLSILFIYLSIYFLFNCLFYIYLNVLYSFIHFYWSINLFIYLILFLKFYIYLFKHYLFKRFIFICSFINFYIYAFYIDLFYIYLKMLYLFSYLPISRFIYLFILYLNILYLSSYLFIYIYLPIYLFYIYLNIIHSFIYIIYLPVKAVARCVFNFVCHFVWWNWASNLFDLISHQNADDPVRPGDDVVWCTWHLP